MAYNIFFKKGSYANFKTKVLNGSATEGTLYFTEDEGGLYLGVKKQDNSVVAQRIQGVVQQFANINDFKSKVAPPYDQNVIFYIADQNALVKWTGTEFVVLNATAAELAAEVSAREALAERVTAAEGTIAEHITTISGLQGDVGTNTEDIADIKETLSALTGSEGAGGTIAEQITTAVTVEKDRAEAAESALDEKIDANAEDISELSTDLAGYKTTVSETYATKEELTNHATTAASTYATKEELTNHATTAASTYATQTALSEVSEVASGAAAQAGTNATAITTLEGVVNNYKTSNDAALAGVKATAEAAVTQVDYDAKMLLLDAEDEAIRELIADEKERAEGIEADHETRISVMETWFNAAADQDGTIESLTELLDYLEAHKGEATDMAADIQANTNAINTLEGYVGIPASGSGDGAVAATGLHLAVDTLEADLAEEVTNRTSAITNAITECNEYTDEALTWKEF